MHDFLTGKIDSLPEAKDYEPPKNFESLSKPIPPVKQDILIYQKDFPLMIINPCLLEYVLVISALMAGELALTRVRLPI